MWDRSKRICKICCIILAILLVAQASASQEMGLVQGLRNDLHMTSPSQRKTIRPIIEP